MATAMALNANEMEMVNSGYGFIASQGAHLTIEILNDQSGDVITEAHSVEEAWALCDKLGVKRQFLRWDELKELRRKWERRHIDEYNRTHGTNY